MLREVLRHGILAEREAEIVTDGIRALLLEIHGYKASVFEFISPRAHRQKSDDRRAAPRGSRTTPRRCARGSASCWRFYGIREQRLARLLGE